MAIKETESAKELRLTEFRWLKTYTCSPGLQPAVLLYL